MPNFLYEFSPEKKIIGKLKNWKILNKFFYYDTLDNLDFEQPSYFFLQDKKFKFYYKAFFIEQEEKVSIKQLQNLINSFKINSNESIIWYIINNIEINNKPSKYLLWKKWKISFWLWIYTLENKHLEIIERLFWKKYNVKIFPNSFFSVQCISKIMKNWSFLYLWKEQTKLIQIKSWFYNSVEILPLWLNYINSQLQEIFHDQNLNNLNDFSKKVYLKKIKELLEPISLFLKENIVSDKIYIIWDFKNYPKLLEELSNSIKTKILPLKVDGKSFDTIYKLDLYCISKNYDKIW